MTGKSWLASLPMKVKNIWTLFYTFRTHCFSLSSSSVPPCSALTEEPSLRKKTKTVLPEAAGDLHDELFRYLFSQYDFRYNVLTDRVEFRLKKPRGKVFSPLGLREQNTLVIEARRYGVDCWDKDVERLLLSDFVPLYHPFRDYMSHLPSWDGKDRIVSLARRVDDDPVWIKGFRCWLLGLAAQWMGQELQCANALIPVLISARQGMSKSTFCRRLMPPELSAYYLDKFDINARSNAEMKLGKYGLINLDEMDRYSPAAMATLKNLVQLQNMSVKKAYSSYFVNLNRIASFIATSNQLELLNDPTGSRRFLCVEVKHSINCSAIAHAQLFAQLKALLQQGERTWMDTAEEKELQRHNLLFSRSRPEYEAFMKVFGIPRQGDVMVQLTTSEIYRQLCRKCPIEMRSVNVLQLGRVLSAMDLKRLHTQNGTKYTVKAAS